jgi:hypothetical protein
MAIKFGFHPFYHLHSGPIPEHLTSGPQSMRSSGTARESIIAMEAASGSCFRLGHGGVGQIIDPVDSIEIQISKRTA